jgi:hypothetical protein
MHLYNLIVAEIRDYHPKAGILPKGAECES